jgi:small-conductance mechanosensitive channel
MKARQWMVTLGLLGLVLMAAVGLVLTRESAPEGSQNKARRAPLVDERPLRTARSMAALASGRDEQRFAQQVLRLADHEVDLAFAIAMREAAAHMAQPTQETQELYSRANKAEALVKADQARVEQLKKQLASSSGPRLSTIQQQLDLMKAQLELDQDELEDAKEDLIRSGADPMSRIRRQFARHEATQHESEANPQPSNNADVNYRAGNLVAEFTAWRAVRGKALQLQQARDQALQDAEALKQTHDSLDKQVNAEEANKHGITQQANDQLNSDQSESGKSAETTTAAITSLRELADDQKNLADLDKRIQDHQELANTYSNWIGVVQSHQRGAARGMIRSALWITLILLAVYVTDRLIDRFFTDLRAERKRLRTLRVVIRFAAQAVGVLLILFVLFGTPSQMPTILGLAGAGLTVALKDFIVAFFGWFVLMGRNGIRVGDWVEINGVGGEVVEIGLLRTVLLETGNWTDAGHPTGRKVAFVNSYAIEGHFFNFSTTGQWLWDELQVLVPVGENPYPVIDAIQKLVTEETAANARMAEQEWQHASSRYRVRSVSAAPAINVRPTKEGVEVLVRYITRAHERYETRSRLYQAVVDLLHRKKTTHSEASSTPAQAAEKMAPSRTS